MIEPEVYKEATKLIEKRITLPSYYKEFDPNSGLIALQKNAVIKLEQLNISNWYYIKKFLNDYFYYCTISGNAFDQDLGKKLFNKLPGVSKKLKIHKS